MKNTIRLLVLLMTVAVLLTGCSKSAPQEAPPVQTSPPMSTPAPEPMESTPAPAPAEASGEPSGSLEPREEVEPEGPADEGIEGLNAPPEAAPVNEVPEDPGAANTGTEGVFTSEAQDFSVAYDSSTRPAETDDGSGVFYLTDADDLPYITVCRVSGQTADEYLTSELDTLKAEQEVVMDSGAAEPANVSGLDVQTTWANYNYGDTMITMVAYARETDGGVLACAAYFDEATAGRALELLEAMIVSVQTPAA